MPEEGVLYWISVHLFLYIYIYIYIYVSGYVYSCKHIPLRPYDLFPGFLSDSCEYLFLDIHANLLQIRYPPYVREHLDDRLLGPYAYYLGLFPHIRRARVSISLKRIHVRVRVRVRVRVHMHAYILYINRKMSYSDTALGREYPNLPLLVRRSRISKEVYR